MSFNIPKLSGRARLKGTSTLEYGTLIGLIAAMALGAVIYHGKTQRQILEDIHVALDGSSPEDGDFIDGGWWFNGQVNAPSASCWAGTAGVDTIEYPENLIYQCFQGFGGDDVMYGNDQDNTITGGVDNDTIYGDAGDDNINASEGNNIVYGGSGNDSITSGSDSSTIDAGEGNDTISVLNKFMHTHYVTGGAGADTLDIVAHTKHLSIHTFFDFEPGVDRITSGATEIFDLFNLPSGISFGEKDGNLLLRMRDFGVLIELPSVDKAPFNLAQTPGALHGTETDDVFNNGAVIWYDTDGEYFDSPSVTEIRLLGGNDVGSAENLAIYGGDGDDTITVWGGGGSGYGENGNDYITLSSTKRTPAFADGGPGNDIIDLMGGDSTEFTVAGGAGSDIFNKIGVGQDATKDAYDIIKDFEPGLDTFQIAGVNFDFNAPMAGYTLSDNIDGNAIISYNAADVIVFEGVTVADLTAP